MYTNTALLMQQLGDAYDGLPVMEINTAQWELNLHLLEMEYAHSSHLLRDKITTRKHA
jgi:hypothetical protein